jgi:thiamine pyrophosphate-dependent acetolactate synthase large subunit-like protein
MTSARIQKRDEIDAVIATAFKANAPFLVEVNTSLDAILP